MYHPHTPPTVAFLIVTAYAAIATAIDSTGRADFQDAAGAVAAIVDRVQEGGGHTDEDEEEMMEAWRAVGDPSRDRWTRGDMVQMREVVALAVFMLVR